MNTITYYMAPYCNSACPQSKRLSCILPTKVLFLTICCPVTAVQVYGPAVYMPHSINISTILTTQCLTMAVHIQCPDNSVLHSINTNTITCYTVHYCCSACAQLSYMLNTISINTIIAKLTDHNLKLPVVSQLK